MANILIVDDEKSIRKTFEAFLIKEGHKVFIAEDVPAALNIFNENQIDIVYTDIIMPKITGIELLGIIKQQNPDIPVIIMTGEPTIETAKQSVHDNAQEYLIKPISKENLLKSTWYALEHKKLLDEKRMLEIENESYKENLERIVDERTASLNKAINGTIETIAQILEIKDPYTAGHEKNVANLSLAIANKMNLSEDQKDCVYFAGYLHDIGKLMLPSEILSKPGRLSEIEYALVKEHVKLGNDLIKNIEFQWPIDKVIYQHHERINGSGYPEGIKGSQMTVGSKILAVADVVEAMSSHRPYRPKLSIKTALDEITDNSGILYDQEVVKATVSLFINDGYDIESNNKKQRKIKISK